MSNWQIVLASAGLLFGLIEIVFRVVLDEPFHSVTANVWIAASLVIVALAGDSDG